MDTVRLDRTAVGHHLTEEYGGLSGLVIPLLFFLFFYGRGVLPVRLPTASLRSLNVRKGVSVSACGRYEFKTQHSDDSRKLRSPKTVKRSQMSGRVLIGEVPSLQSAPRAKRTLLFTPR